MSLFKWGGLPPPPSYSTVQIQRKLKISHIHRIRKTRKSRATNKTKKHFSLRKSNCPHPLTLTLMYTKTRSLCVRWCVLAWLSVIRKIRKWITAESSNLVFCTYITCRCYLKYFMKIGIIVCMHGCTKEFKKITDYGRNVLLMHCNRFRLKLNLIKWTYIFNVLKKSIINKIWYDSLSSG